MNKQAEQRLKSIKKHKRVTAEVYAAGTPWEYFRSRQKHYFDIGEVSDAFEHKLDVRGKDDHSVISRPGHEKEVPEWTLNDKRIVEVLWRSFPKLGLIRWQRRAATRWFLVIHMYYRQNLNRRDIASRLKVSLGTVCSLLRNIKRAGEGRRADGKGELGRPRGHRRKVTGALKKFI